MIFCRSCERYLAHLSLANNSVLTRMKMETYHGKGKKEHHGDSGPTGVSKGTHTAHRAEDSFLEAAAKIGYPELEDLQNLDANNGIERYQKYVGPNGRRSDSAHKYLHPKIRSGDYPNLHVLVEKQVVRVIFDEDKRAVGVEYQHNPKFLANPEFMTAKQTLRTARARKMVIVSSGANGTPLILERSGVGDPKILERAGVPVVEDLPGVGHDYQDHHLTLYAYRTNLTSKETINKCKYCSCLSLAVRTLTMSSFTCSPRRASRHWSSHSASGRAPRYERHGCPGQGPPDGRGS